MKIPAFWISGNLYEVSLTINDILDKYGRDNLITIDATSSTVERIIYELMNVDIFNTKPKVILLKRLPENYTYLSNHLQYVTDKCVLIIDCPKSLKINNRDANVALSTLYKEIKKKGQVIEFPEEAKPGETEKWAIGVCKQAFNRTLDVEASELLCDLKNCNFNNIFSELNKIVTYIGKRRKITIEDVRACTTDELQFDNWKFIDDLTAGKYELAVEHAEKLFSTAKYIVFDCEFTISAIIYRYELMLFAREVGKHPDFDKIKKQVNSFQKIKKKDGETELSTKYSDGLLRMFCYSNYVKDALNRLSRPRIAEILSALYFVQNSIRFNSGNKARCKLLFMEMIRELCGSVPQVRRNFGSSQLMMTE